MLSLEESLNTQVSFALQGIKFLTVLFQEERVIKLLVNELHSL